MMKSISIALVSGVAMVGTAVPALAQEAKSNYNLTSMCRPDTTTGSWRVRNLSTLEQPYTLRRHGTTQVVTGTAAAGTDTLVRVPWTSSRDTWILTIDGWSFTKAIGANAICS